MPRKTITMDLDFIQKDIAPRFTVKQADDLILNINVLMNGEPYEIEGQTGRFYVGVNKKVFVQTNNISIIENTATITLDRSLLQKHGKALGELEITGDEGRILSLSFVFYIEKNLTDDAVSPEEYKNYIEECEASIEEFKQTLQDDYNSLRQVIIDENVSVNLQLQIDENASQLAQIPNLVIETYSDDSINSSLINVVNDCISKNKKLNLHKKEYVLNNRITFTNLCDIEGNGATLVVNDMIDFGEFAILLNGLKDVTIRDLNFEIKDTSPYRTLLGLYNSNNVKFINCKFIANFETVEATHNTLDLYKGNVDIVFDNCTFLQLNNGDEGGIWVRNAQDSISKNINFNNCKFYKRGYDEILAIWGWQGEVSNVNVNNSDFYIYAGDKIPDWVITLGQSGITQCKLSNCNIYCEEHASLFRCVGESRAVVENCKITSLKSSTSHQALVQSDSNAYFEIRGCDISLECTAGSIAAYANNIENNVFNITSHTGFISCGNIKGNKINATTSSYLLASNENVDSNIFNITCGLGRFEENTNNLKNNKCSITANNVNGSAIFKNDKNSIIKNNQLTLTVTTGNIKLINLSNDSGKYIFAQNDIIINSGYYASNNTKLGTFVSYNNIVNYVLDNI